MYILNTMGIKNIKIQMIPLLPTILRFNKFIRAPFFSWNEGKLSNIFFWAINSSATHLRLL